jgi:hypothetical protein
VAIAPVSTATMGRHHRGRRGDRARRHPPGVVPRPVRRSRVVDQQL